MTNLDVMCKALAHATGKPESHFREVIMGSIEYGMPPGKLLEECSDGEALVEKLKGEAEGILAWVVDGAAMAYKHGAF